MMRFLIGSLLSTVLMSASCGKDKAPAAVPPGTTPPPVETQSPNTDYKPAFEGQTRVAGVQTSTPLDVKVISKDLQKPWGVAVLPDGRLIITQKEGSLRIVSADGTTSAPITGLLAVDSRGQGGLLDIAPDPDFPTNRMLYWTFSEPVAGGNLTAVAKGKLSADEKRIEAPQVIYRAVPAYDGTKHYGSRLVFDRNGALFVSTGERSDLETRPKAQDLTTALGKILHITRDGQPASGALFPGNPGALPAIYSYGHRNVQSLALHPETGVLWEAEMGPRGGDEVNVIQGGKNYGWPIITYGQEYSGEKIGAGITQKEGLEQPVYYWDPSVSPGGMSFYNGSEIPEWRNNLFIGCLSGQHIVRLVLNGTRVVGEERLLQKEGERFRDVAAGADGALYAITDSGKLYRIGKKKV